MRNGDGAADDQGYVEGVNDLVALPAFLAAAHQVVGDAVVAVLRCDDCITYHLVRCGEEGWKRDEVIDALNVALIVGGSITIPHVRRAFARMREIKGLKP